MRKIFTILAISFVCAFGSTGCDTVSDIFAPKFDATSAETFEASYTKIKNSLSSEDQQKLNDALLYMSAKYLKEHPKEAIVAGAAALIHDGMDNAFTRGFGQDLMKTFDGKSGKRVIREYEEMKK